MALYEDSGYQRYVVKNVGAANVVTDLNGSVLWVGGPDFAVLPKVGNPGVELHVTYQSLSGRDYVSVVAFGSTGDPAGTRIESRSKK